MFVWSKTINASQEEYFEDRFLGMAQTNAVITKLSDAKKLRVEVFLEKKNSAETQSILEETKEFLTQRSMSID